MNTKDKEFLLDMAKHINNCYRKYYQEMTARGLPLEVNSFARGLEKALIEIIGKGLTFKKPEQDKASLGYVGDQNSPIPIYKEANPLYRDSVEGEEIDQCPGK